MARNLILSGGAFHDFTATSEALAEVLTEVGVESEITEDIAGALAERPEVQLITVNALRCRMTDGRFREQADRWRFELPAEGRTALLDHLDRGHGLLAVHAATLCFDDWRGWPRVLGGCWNPEKSHHPPLGWTEVRVLAATRSWTGCGTSTSSTRSTPTSTSSPTSARSPPRRASRWSGPARYGAAASCTTPSATTCARSTARSTAACCNAPPCGC
jgi:hypothetical protein